MVEFIVKENKEIIFNTNDPDEYYKYIEDNKDKELEVTLKKGKMTFVGKPHMISIYGYEDIIKMCNIFKDCYTCGNCATHKTWRDALDEYEWTCDKCHKEEYPEEYE